MSIPEDAMTRFAKLLARKDAKAGGYIYGGWGAAVIAWAAGMRLEHKDCGKLDVSPMEDFSKGLTDKPTVSCPIHGRLEGPEIPKGA